MNVEQARELLPWYAAGSLDADEARLVAEQVEKSDELARELQQLRLVHDAVAEVGDEEPAFRPEMIQEALQQIDTMEADNVVSVSWDKKITEAANEYLRRLQWGMTPTFAKVAVVGQFALVAALSAALLTQQPADQVSETLSGKSAQIDSRPLLNLSFKPGVSEIDLRTYLTELNAEIVAGPSALGIYTIALSGSTDPQSLLPQIKENELIQYIALVPE